MQLPDLIAGLTHAQDAHCIVAVRPWTEKSEARLVQLTHDFRLPANLVADGFEYLIEVSIALDEVLGNLADVLTPEQRFNAVVFYAENDAHPDWLCNLRG